MTKEEAKQRAEMFFCSERTKTWWKYRNIDKPNKFIGNYENLPEYVKKLRFRYGGWR